MIRIPWALQIAPLDNGKRFRVLGFIDREFVLMHCNLSVKERADCTLIHTFSIGLGKRSSRAVSYLAVCQTTRNGQLATP